MTTGELLVELAKRDPDARVFLEGRDGSERACCVEPRRVRGRVVTWIRCENGWGPTLGETAWLPSGPVSPR